LKGRLLTIPIALAALSASGSTTADERRPAAVGEQGGRTTIRASAEVGSYADTDAVLVASPSVAGSVSDDVAGWSVNGRYLVDAVSAASVDIVSSASPHWFEYRHVGSLGVDYKPGGAGISASGTVSREPDYLSMSGGGTFSFELLDKNLTPYLGGSYGHDDVGRTGMPRADWKSLQRVGLQAGATFVVDRSTIANLAFDATLERGYLAKPYRYIPLFDASVSAGIPAGASGDLVNRRSAAFRPAEELPDARDRFALTGKIAHRFDLPATLRLDERLYRDSWALIASTTEAHFMLDLGARFIVLLHGRFHAQTGVSFWQRAYRAPIGPDQRLQIPQYRAGERELSPLEEITGGAGFRWRLTRDPRRSWALSIQLDEMRARYFDALYITSRMSLFGVVVLEAEIQ
jgi:hypothetical protein